MNEFELFQLRNFVNQMPGLPGVQRNDANETAILAQKLEHIKSKVYEVKYPLLKARTLIPVESDVHPGAMTIAYEVDDIVGEAQWASNENDEPPFADVNAVKVTTNVQILTSAYRYSMFDLQASAMAGVPLEQKRANAARKIIEHGLEKTAALGVSRLGLQGLYTSSTSTVTASAGAWSGLTEAQILGELNALITGIAVDTNEVQQATTIVLPIAAHSRIRTLKSGVDSGETVLSFFLKTNPTVKEVVSWVYGNTAGALGVTRAVAYAKDPDVLTLEIPQEFTAMAAQLHNYSWRVPCFMKTAGVSIKQPKAIRYLDGC